MKSLIFIIVSLTIILLAVQADGQSEMVRPPRLDLVKIELTSRYQAKELDNLGVIINQVRDDYCIAEVSPSLLTTILNRGFNIITLQEDISGEYYNNFFTKCDRGRYLTYTEFVDTMNIIAVNNPSICKLETLGMSHQNRLLLALKISDSVEVDENEPAIYFDANIHGDEKIGWAVCFEFIKYIMTNYGFNPVVADLVNNREIWIVPMINPDGYVNNVRYNGRSIDVNRNFGWMWGNEVSCGTDMFSENEATAFYNLFWRQPFVIYTTYHAGDSVVSCPWSFTTYDSIPEKYLTWHLAQRYSQNGNYYPYGQGSIIMYTINGASKDFTYGVQGEVSWSIELCNTKTPPATWIDPCFNINKNAMLYLITKAGQGIHGLVVDSITEQPLDAQVWFMPRNWLTYTSKTNGDFHRFYLPGTYTIITRCPGYKDDTLSVVVPNTGDSSVFVNIKMVPDTNAVSNYAMRLVGSRYVTTSSNRTYPLRALGVHDNTAYQLDNTKWIVLEMAKPIQNNSGYDFTVFRSSGTGTASVKISNNWKGPWTTIGTANAAQTHFDLATVSFDTARYVRLDASNTFGLDAIEKYHMTSGIQANESNWNITNYHLQLFSNIVRSSLRIKYSPVLAKDFCISIHDASGRNIQNLTLLKGTDEYIYNLRNSKGEHLQSGIYFIKVDGQEKTIARFTVIR